jgi:hypothetical protein
MHCELVVPGLFSGGAIPRLSALELLLARGRRSSKAPQRLETWAQEVFELGEGPFPAGQLTLLGQGSDQGETSWVRADPVHLRVLRDRVVVIPAEAFDLPVEEARAFCEALNAHFPQLELVPVQPRRWCARLEGIGEDRPSLEVAGKEPEMPPQQARALLTEVQMVLHAHPLNEAREARGEPPVNSVWFWGSGRAAGASSRWQSVAADDPAVVGAARLAGARHRALPRSASEWLERLAGEGRHLAVLDVLRAPLALGSEVTEEKIALERDWFGPILAVLRADRIGMVSVHVPDGRGGVSFETIRGDLRRFWRLPKSIERYA